MKIQKLISARDISPNWDQITESIYQKLEFLLHIEKYNPCNQRYYVGYDDFGKIACGAVVYSLKLNILTFSKYSFNITASIVGIPASVDASGIIGENTESINNLIISILQQEKGVIIGFNCNLINTVDRIIKMQTLPTLIFEKKQDSWNDFLQNIKHNYRRRITKAEEKTADVEKRVEPCSCFTEEHYNQYLAIMSRTKTKLETLSFDFFYHLPENYQLTSLYHRNDLLGWHISTSDDQTFYWLCLYIIPIFFSVCTFFC